MHIDWRLFGLVGILLVAAALWTLLGRPARLERRRRRSHGRIVSKANRPMVRLSVRRPRDKDRN